MIAGPSSSRRKARTRSTERVISVLGRSSTGKPARYIFEPARDSPSGSLTTSTPELLEPPPEVERRVEGVDLGGARARVVAQEDHVEVDQARGLARRVRRGQRLRVAGGVAQPARLGPHHLGDDVRALALRERVHRGERDVVPAAVGREREVQRRVRRALRARSC